MGKYLHLFQRERPEAAVAGEAFMILEFEKTLTSTDGSLAKD